MYFILTPEINNIARPVTKIRIKLFVSESWKYDIFKKLKEESSRDISYLIKKYMIKEYSKELVSVITSVIKNPKKIPEIILSQEKEYQMISDNKSLIEKEFNARVEIIKGLNDKAYPGKIAIVLE